MVVGQGQIGKLVRWVAGTVDRQLDRSIAVAAAVVRVASSPPARRGAAALQDFGVAAVRTVSNTAAGYRSLREEPPSSAPVADVVAVEDPVEPAPRAVPSPMPAAVTQPAPAAAPPAEQPGPAAAAAKQTAAQQTAAKATPAKSTPAKATPAKSTPAKSTPAKSTPAKSTPATATPAKKSAAKKTTAPATPGKKTAAKKTPADVPAKKQADAPDVTATKKGSPAPSQPRPGADSDQGGPRS